MMDRRSSTLVDLHSTPFESESRDRHVAIVDGRQRIRPSHLDHPSKRMALEGILGEFHIAVDARDRRT